MSIKTVLQTFRPSFLVLTPVGALLGLSTVLTMQTPINQVVILLIFIGALFDHISVNTLNEYFDFKNGLDLTTNKTQFSSGSGELATTPGVAGLVLKIGLLSLLITVIVGVTLLSNAACKYYQLALLVWC